MPVLLLFSLVWAVVAPARARAQDELPATVAIEVRDADLATTGRFSVRIRIEPKERIARSYSIRLVFRAGDREILSLDHAPPTATPDWLPDTAITYELPIQYPLLADTGRAGDLDIWVGFHDAERRRTIPPREAFDVLRNGLGRVGSLEIPIFRVIAEETTLEETLARAASLAQEKRHADAWSVLETGLRLAIEDDAKHRLRDAMRKLGSWKMRALTPIEEQITARRIEAEKRRYLRLVAGRLYDRGMYHGSLRIIEAIGGKLAEDSRAAVIGALDGAERTERDRQDTRRKILEVISGDEKQLARQEIEKLGSTRKLLDRALAHAAAKRYAIARMELREMRFAEDRTLKDEAFRRLDEVEATWVADTPADQAERVRRAIAHPAWARTRTIPTRNFILIGPETLVEHAVEDSILRFDLAYVFLSDLFGRVPNPGGDRVTVYFKELWDFGGGVGGGKTIDIGRADPDQKGLRLDTGLMYHELTHCIDDTNPVFAGHREGLADFGATYAFEAIGQQRSMKEAFARHLAAFRSDYLERDLEYWRIPQYAPSAGFFLHFVDRHARRGDGHDWKPYRRFFREYRRAPVRDGREPAIARSMAHHLVRAFGPEVFDELMSFRMPLEESDREAVSVEVEAFAESDFADFRGEEAAARYPNSPLVRDLRARELLALARAEPTATEDLRELGAAELGIVHDWHCIGPFKTDGADPDAVVFPPEYEVDFAKEYEGKANILRWQEPGRNPPVRADGTGWVRFDYGYQDDSAIYALTHVTVDRDTDAVAHLRADDDVTLFVDDELAGKYRGRGRNASSWLWWRGPAGLVPDAIRFRVRLRAGRNAILVKIKNRSGAAGFALALARPDGRPIPGLRSDAGPTAAVEAKAKVATWQRVARHRFESRSFRSKLEVAAGAFQVRRKRLVGTATARGVAWRKYTVRPGFPKDSPSNLFWLQPKTTRKLGASLRLTLDLETDRGRVPKIAVTLMGDGGRDGLSGLTLVVHPSRGDAVAARLERYDRLVYQTPPLTLPSGDGDHRLSIVYDAGRLTARLGELVLFSNRSIRAIPGRDRIGVMTWGPNTRLAGLELERRKAN